MFSMFEKLNVSVVGDFKAKGYTPTWKSLIKSYNNNCKGLFVIVLQQEIQIIKIIFHYSSKYLFCACVDVLYFL